MMVYDSSISDSLNNNYLSVLGASGTSSTNWNSSPWFGSFYLQPSGWLFHQELNWLYISPDFSNGLWIWNVTGQVWWWTNENIFPYVNQHNSSLNKQGWLYLDLSQQPYRTYEFLTNTWK